MYNFKDKLIEAKKQQKESDIEYGKDPEGTNRGWYIGDLVEDAVDPQSTEWDRQGQLEATERKLHKTQALLGRLTQALYERKVINTEELAEITYYL